MMNPIQALRSTYITRIFVCTGRSTRAEVWWCFFISSTLVYLLEERIGGQDIIKKLLLEDDLDVVMSWLEVSVSFSTFYLFSAQICAFIRRVHDVGLPGHFLAVALIPILGGVGLLVLLCWPSDPEENQWGAPYMKGRDDFSIWVPWGR